MQAPPLVSVTLRWGDPCMGLRPHAPGGMKCFGYDLFIEVLTEIIEHPYYQCFELCIW